MVDELASAEHLQAVLVADSFACTFWPITAKLPKALVPLANIPLIDYAVEFLARNKVKELIVFCTVLPEMVEQHIGKVRVKGCKIKCHQDESCKSMGDVLRALDQSQLVKNDFILMTADIVSNADLTECLERHKSRRKSNGDFILTRIFKCLPFKCRLRTSADQITVALKGEEIVQFDDLREQSEIHMKCDFSSSSEFNIRMDLVDTGMCVCTPELLSRVTDNFDFHTMDQVVKELLTNDIYTDKVAAYVVPPHAYLSRAQDPRTYDGIAKDVLARWTHPIVLNNNLLPYAAATTYRCQHIDLYMEEGVVLSYTAVVTSPSAIGAKTRIDDDAKVIRSVVGRDCHIKEGAKVEGSYLWEGVKVGRGSEVTQAILCTGCIVGDNCKVPVGSVLAPGVELPDNTVLIPNTRLSTSPPKESAAKPLGNAYIHWPLGDDQERIKHISEQCMGGTLRIWTEEDDYHTDSSDGTSDDDSVVYDEDGKPIIADAGQSSAVFVEEVKELVKESMAQDEDLDGLYHSLNSTKFAQNRSVKECISGIIRGLFHEAPPNVRSLINRWANLLKNFQAGLDDQLHIIREIEAALEPISCRKKFHVILAELYNLEIVEDKAIFTWAEENKDEELAALTVQFVEYLRDEGDEEDDED